MTCKWIQKIKGPHTFCSLFGLCNYNMTKWENDILLQGNACKSMHICWGSHSPLFPLQRYFVNEDFYKPGGPVFLMIGGEGPANPAWMKEGTWLTYAQKLGALCFMLEHRFYGKSHPTTYVFHWFICMMLSWCEFSSYNMNQFRWQ